MKCIIAIAMLAATEAWLFGPTDIRDTWNQTPRFLPIQTCREVVWKPCGNLAVFTEQDGYCLPPAGLPRYCASGHGGAPPRMSQSAGPALSGGSPSLPVIATTPVTACTVMSTAR